MSTPVLPPIWQLPDGRLASTVQGVFMVGRINPEVGEFVLPAGAVRLVADEVETAWEAATGELEELRRQLDQRDVDLARVTQERDQARTQRDAALAMVERASLPVHEVSVDFLTNDDRVCANDIAAAIRARYGAVKLSLLYQSARMAMDVCGAWAAAADAREAVARPNRWNEGPTP